MAGGIVYAQTAEKAPPPPGFGQPLDPAPALPTAPADTPSTATAPHASDLAIINAATYKPVPAGLTYTVVLFEDTPQAERTRDALEDALLSAGYQLGNDDAALQISFDSARSMAPKPTQNGILSVDGHGGASGNTNQIKAEIDVFSSDKSSLTTGERQLPSGGPRLRFQLYLTDATTGQRLWEGWGTTTLGPRTAEDAAQAMLPDLIAAIGKTVRNHAVSLTGK